MIYDEKRYRFKSWDPVKKVMSEVFTLYDIALSYDCGCPIYEGFLGSVYESSSLMINSTKDQSKWPIVLQSTGATDKDGVEVWEGDILLADWDDKRESLLAIEWLQEPEETGRFVFIRANGPYKGLLDEFWAGDDTKVIGNIYENPELLEEKQ